MIACDMQVCTLLVVWILCKTMDVKGSRATNKDSNVLRVLGTPGSASRGNGLSANPRQSFIGE